MVYSEQQYYLAATAGILQSIFVTDVSASRAHPHTRGTSGFPPEVHVTARPSGLDKQLARMGWGKKGEGYGLAAQGPCPTAH